MSTTVTAALVLGLPRKELADVPNIQTLIDDAVLDEVRAFDGDDDRSVVGLVVAESGSYSPRDAVLNLDLLTALSLQFVSLVGIVPRLLISPRVR